jgi:hypothetical protein
MQRLSSLTAKGLAWALALIIFVAIGGLIGFAKVGLYATLDRFISGPVAFGLCVIFGSAIVWYRWQSRSKG